MYYSLSLYICLNFNFCYLTFHYFFYFQTIPDYLHCNESSSNDSSYDDKTTKFYTYLAMARSLFHNEGNIQYYNSRINTFPYSLHRSIKYFTLENKKLPLVKFIKNLNMKLYANVKSGKVRSYFREYEAISVQTLSKRSYYDKLSHLRRVQITVDTFINVLEEHDEIARLEKVWDEFNKQWIEYDTDKSGEVVFTDLINIYDEFELPKGAQWGSRERAKGLLATKPSIEELFKNIKVKNNKCSYDDSIYSFLNCWMGEELPESYVKKERVVPQTGYEKKNIEKTKEKVVPQTGYEEKNIETTKEKVHNIYDGYDSTAVASSSSTPISVNTLNPNNTNYNELMNANYNYYRNEADEEEIRSSSSQNVGTYYQFNNKNTERINILVDDAPRSSGRIRLPLATSSSSLYSYDDECTTNSKYMYYEEPLESEIYIIEDNQRNYINNPIINNNAYNNIKIDNYYLSATTNSSSEDNCSNNSNSERTPLTSKFKYQLNHNKMEDRSNIYAGHEENLNGSNYSNNKKFKFPFRKTFTETFSKSKTVLLPSKETFSESFSKGKAIHLPSIDTFSESFSKGKAIHLPSIDTFSETFSKGKAIILPKNKNSTSTKETSIEDQEIPFNVAYKIWKLQYRFKEKRQQIQEGEKISIV
ncbi:hypothetical protein LY90DRAFT_638744 [Neocallimastix californiae]|uniref:EF-hand domain-containing protein n=1 Tax=Neocallimastix californiae TaxID=1754190 RepID=A0A1Y1ZE60_9FUNG|nr:hypothetical protein LY90DRAFT_638744 [Neocallimastix californiae]|eukprot:ORY08560.1 hypothetical protein LY90DRAFT_638744 [Neocallimastix californiae]